MKKRLLPFDLEIPVRNSIPILFELLDDKKIDWKQINKTVWRKIQEYEERYIKLGETFLIQASFMHILIKSSQDDEPARRLLDYIQKLFEELNIQLDALEKKQIAGTIFNLLVNFDSKYLNFLGELSVLNLYKRRFGFRLKKQRNQ